MTRRYYRQGDVDELGRQLTSDDQQIVKTVARFRLTSAQQLARLHFPDHDSSESAARRRRYQLARLVKADVLARLPRRVGGYEPGSAGYVYRLGPVGHRLVEATGSRNRAWKPTNGFIRHTLAISESFVTLEEMQRREELKLLTFDPEPICWRPFTGSGGEPEHLKPDGYIVIQSDGFEAHWYLEIDRGTEGGQALKGKLDRYLRYFQTGTEQANLGFFPQIRFVVSLSGTPSLQTEGERVEQIERVVARLPESAQRLFIVHTLDELADRVRAGPTTP